MQPLSMFREIRDFFITYLDTAFRIRHDRTTRLRRALLESTGTLCAAPFLESVPTYEQSEHRAWIGLYESIKCAAAGSS